jgi:hypothetical protein
MKRGFTLAFIILACCSYLISYGQPPLNYYNVVKLEKDAVKNALAKSGFSYLEFSFNKVDSSYSMVANAKDKNGRQLGNPIKLPSLVSEKPRRLPNIQQGTFRLPVNVMKEHNVDGSEDYVLTPKKCKDPKNGKEIDYVSYRFSNKVFKNTATASNSEGIFFQAAYIGNLVEFELNPSPPYE